MRLSQTFVPETEKLFPLGSLQGASTASTLITRSFVSYTGFQTDYYPGGTCLVGPVSLVTPKILWQGLNSILLTLLSD